MRIYRHSQTINEQASVVCIGNFDAVHIGHQQLIKTAQQKAQELACVAGVCFFEPQPKEFFLKAKAPKRLTNFRNKCYWLQHFALDFAFCLNFNARLQKLSALEFVQQVLLDKLKVKCLIVGDDFRFGCDRSGDVEFLKAQGQQFGFSVMQASTVFHQHDRVSSSQIRTLLANDQMQSAQAMLGRPYSILGKVIKGQQLARQLGVPTANVLLKTYLPAITGVWAVTVRLSNNRHYQGIANVGQRPTVNCIKPMLEVHLFDFDDDLYGQIIDCTFIEKIRAIEKFSSIEQLKRQIEQDIQQVQQLFNQ